MRLIIPIQGGSASQATSLLCGSLSVGVRMLESRFSGAQGGQSLLPAAVRLLGVGFERTQVGILLDRSQDSFFPPLSSQFKNQAQ